MNDVGKAHEQTLLSGVATTKSSEYCDTEGNGKPLCYIFPRTVTIVGKQTGTALSPEHTLSGQRVRRISRPTLKIGTWNAKSIFEGGKLHNTIQEMKRLNIEIMEISEMRWPGTGECCVDNHTIYYSGKDDRHHRYGVSIIINNRLKPHVISLIS